MDKMVDCEQGRCIGCQTFCCKLIIRITPEEAQKIYPDTPDKISLDKDLNDGFCEFLDRGTFKCNIFEIRPEVCRSYTCNGDKLLQVAIRQKVDTIVGLSMTASSTFIPIETYVKVPTLNSE